MTFGIAVHHNNRRYELICQLLEANEVEEKWKITRREDRSRFTVLISDRPAQLKVSKLKGRFNWLTEDQQPVSNEVLLGLIHWLEWHIWAHLNPGYAGVYRKDDFDVTG